MEPTRRPPPAPAPYLPSQQVDDNGPGFNCNAAVFIWGILKHYYELKAIFNEYIFENIEGADTPPTSRPRALPPLAAG